MNPPVTSLSVITNACNAEAVKISVNESTVSRSAYSTVISSADNSKPFVTLGTKSLGLTTTLITLDTVSAPSVAVNSNGNVPPVIPAALIASN